MFQYKTKGNVSPQGKRRVYFTCHPDDYDRFFEKISSEILKFSDCAIWYNPDDNYENIDTDLGQMNLFVIPITTKLLTKPCRTIELDVPFALKKHIPILPLMQERSLDELFTRHFGDLQYLDPNKHDITAISYEDKLKKYLNFVLVSDEMAEKVRAAFDAYIFLSYRKKDRKYANELMRLIHKNDFCRDIAIWYDEYLVPGEDFNNAITEALKKSDLFAMVVTPNLVNETNYVQTVEYPEAVKQNKTIIPTELEKTDYKVLSEKYPNIPNTVDAHDKVALSGVLHSALLQIAKRENDNDPQHNFFIGLAYLEGIDVEVNHDRALQLITSAAETNEVPEAIEKLVTMYHDGYGVKRDYNIAVEWQQKLVDYWERKYKKSNDVDSFYKLFSTLFSIVDSYNNLDDLENSKSFCTRMITFSEQMNNHRCLVVSYQKMGDIYASKGYLKDALKYYRKFLLVSEHLTREKKTTLSQHDLMIAYNRFGKILIQIGDVKEAEIYLQKAINLNEMLINRTNTIKLRTLLADTYTSMGSIHLIQMCNVKAESFFLKAFDICNQLVKVKDPSIYSTLIAASDNLALLYSIQNKIDKTDFILQNNIFLCEQYVEDTDSIHSYVVLSQCYKTYADSYKERENFEKAEEFYLKAFSILNHLLNKCQSILVKRSLAISCTNLSDLYKERGTLDRSEEFCLKSIAFLEQLVDKFENGADFLLLSNCYTSLGDLYKERGNLDRFEEFYLKAITLLEQSENKNEQLFETEKIQSLAYLALCYTEVATIRKPYNYVLLEKAWNISTKITSKCPQNTDYSELREAIKEFLEE